MRALNIYFNKQNSPGVMAAKLWIREGSRNDSKGNKGIHQLLGSLLCRGCGPYNYLEIGDLIEGCGASLHCETYEDGILISLKCIEDDAYKLLPIIGWMIKEPHINAKQIKLEKELTIQSISRQKEDPFYKTFDGWRQIAFRETPYGHDPLGTIRDLKNLEDNDLIALANELPTRSKVLVIAGSYPNDLEQKINEIEPFDQLLQQNCLKKHGDENFNLNNYKVQNKSDIKLQFENTSQVVFMIGQPTIGYSHKDAISLQLLSCYLGIGMSSKLFIELRENYGVAYDVGVHHPIREYTSPFIIHASTSEEKSPLTLTLIKSLLKNIMDKPICERELLHIKAKYRGLIAHSTQTISQKAERKAHLLGLNLDVSEDKYNLERLDLITSNDLLNVTRKYLKEPILSLCGKKSVVERISKKWNDD